MITDDELKRNLAENLQHLLEVRGWTRYRLAKESGESQVTLAGIVHGRAMPQVGTLARIADCLDVSLDQLIAASSKNLQETA